jgi:hypothetical protein
MSVSVVGEAAVRRAAEDARRSGRSRLATDDAARNSSREHRAYRPGGVGVGVLAALGQAGIRLTLEQRRGIERLMRAHSELATQPFTPGGAVERLVLHGIHFSDRQLELVTDDTTVTGFRRLESNFEDNRKTDKMPVHRPQTAIIEQQAEGFFAWLARVFAWLLPRRRAAED